jgi:hypothetical protein
MCVVQCLSGLMQGVTLPIQDLGVSMTGCSPHSRLIDPEYTVLWHRHGKGRSQRSRLSVLIRPARIQSERQTTQCL